MNFKGLEKLGIIIFVVLGILMTIPALISYLFADRPLLAMGIAALCGGLIGLKLSPVKWPICFGSASAAASLTFGCVVASCGGGLISWLVAVPCAVYVAIATIWALSLLLTDAKRTPPEL